MFFGFVCGLGFGQCRFRPEGFRRRNSCGRAVIRQSKRVSAFVKYDILKACVNHRFAVFGVGTAWLRRKFARILNACLVEP